jgi:uncharacterized protein YndB with AHSA1/START domain
MNQQGTAAVVRAYHEAWTGKDFAGATALLDDALVVEVPVNEYPTAESFAAALAGFGSMVSGVELLAAMSDGDEAMLLYDLDVEGLGPLRVAEHFTVGAGKIIRIRQVHDTMAVRAAGLAGQAMPGDPGQPRPAEATAYTRRVVIHAAPQRAFDAIATLDGLRRWWTTIVTGSPASGGELRFGFAGLDERIVMRVDTVQPPEVVAWSCLAHTRDDQWTGSMVRFELTALGPDACELAFRHSGIDPDLVADGWEHFLASLAAYLEHGAGTPFGA